MPQSGGETGRFPLAIKLIKQVLTYLDGLKKKSMNNDCTSIVNDAFHEQQALDLSWFANITAAKLTLLKHTTAAVNVFMIRKTMDDMFVDQWNLERKENRKLGFYNS